MILNVIGAFSVAALFIVVCYLCKRATRVNDYATAAMRFCTGLNTWLKKGFEQENNEAST